MAFKLKTKTEVQSKKINRKSLPWRGHEYKGEAELVRFKNLKASRLERLCKEDWKNQPPG